MRVWKFPLFLNRVNEIEIPRNATILHFDYQHESTNQSIFQLWALVRAKARKEKRKFIIAFTGEEIKETIISHIGTVIAKDYLLHCFEVK